MVNRNEVLTISILFGVSAFLFIVSLASIIYSKRIKRMRQSKNNPNEWLLYNLSYKLYSAIFGKSDPDKVAMKIGVKLEEYYKNCLIIDTVPCVERLIIESISGIFLFSISVILGILINPIILIIGGLFSLYLCVNRTTEAKNKAEKKKSQIKKELPQYLELLSTELQVGINIDRAIVLLSEKYNCLLSEEFLKSLNDVKLGMAGGWQLALERVAAKYECDILTDFVLNVITAFNKGVSITNSVEMKTKDIKQKYLLDLKEEAGRTENTILFPIAILQFVPVIVFVLIPSLIMISIM